MNLLLYYFLFNLARVFKFTGIIKNKWVNKRIDIGYYSKTKKEYTREIQTTPTN